MVSTGIAAEKVLGFSPVSRLTILLASIIKVKRSRVLDLIKDSLVL